MSDKESTSTSSIVKGILIAFAIIAGLLVCVGFFNVAAGN